MPQPWWERYEGLLEEEIRRLEEAGFRCKIDEDLKKRGLLSLQLFSLLDGKDILMEARYPEHYPYFCPEVFTKDIRLSHHQNPRAGNLCLLERSTSVWHTKHSLASLLTKNLQRVIKAGTAESVEESGIEEVPQPEPISEYFPFYIPGSILFDGSWVIPPDINEGILRVNIIIAAEKSFVAAILAVEDNDGNCLVNKADNELANALKDGRNVVGRWKRVSNILEFTNNLEATDAKRIMAKLQVLDPSLNALKDNQYDITGILFREETEHRKEGDGWIFVLRHSALTRVRKGKKVHQKIHSTPYLLRGNRAGWGDLKARVPMRDILKSKTVTLIGLGCIGAPIALELARAGVKELRIMDPDTTEAGNAVRWPLGFSAAGTPKVMAISEFIRQNIPYTKVIFKIGKIGGVVFPDEVDSETETHGQMLDSILNGTDLIIDATGKDGVNHYLSKIAQEQKIPIIFAATTVGTWGGDIVRIIPGETQGCWSCYGYHQIDKNIPKPPKDPSPEAAEIIPRGCAAPTFSGNQFDASIISMTCVRIAIGILLRGTGEYPIVDGDVMIIRLRDHDGNAIVPIFESYPLERHESCESNLH